MVNSSKTFGKLTIPLLVLLAICFWAFPAYAKYGGGTGEPNDPYLIYDANQMNAIGADSNDWDKHFKLMADIDLSGFTGTSFNIIGYLKWDPFDSKPFKGVFDGSGHTISNFTYDSNGVNYIGLFGFLSAENAEIRDLGLIDPDVDAGTGDYVGSLVGNSGGNISNCYVEGGSVSGDYAVGGLVGSNGWCDPWYCYAGMISNCYSSASVSGGRCVGGLAGTNNGTISDCYATGSVSGGWSVGGLVGGNFEGTICNCYSEGNVSGTEYSVGGLVGLNWKGLITNCYSTGNFTGVGYVGGLVGCNWGGIISNCYSSGSVSGETEVGGLVGANERYCDPGPWGACFYGIISNCYSTGSVAGDGSVGGLVGKNYWGDINDSFWDIETSGQTTSAGGTGKTTAEMQTMSTFTDAGWDFTTPVWTIDEGVDYPRLWWEISLVLHAEPEVTLGTRNIISWDPVPGANDYYAECAADVNFTNILYNSGWITETSYTFTSLVPGRIYWYSVKGRNSVGTETGWSNVESSLQVTLADVVETLLNPVNLKNKNMKNALLNKINAVQQMIDEGLYEAALNKLQNDILQKTNGCAETGRPDKNDWIITCEQQCQIYPLFIETIEYVKSLME